MKNDGNAYNKLRPRLLIYLFVLCALYSLRFIMNPDGRIIFDIEIPRWISNRRRLYVCDVRVKLESYNYSETM